MYPNVKTEIKFPHLTILTLVTLVVIIILGLIQNYGNNIVTVANLILFQEKKNTSKNLECDLFTGRWVYDNASYPLYKEKECNLSFCEKYGRKDLRYQNWRWQPHDCDIPRFYGKALLDKIRGKKLVFVGDSLGRNQWESMVCLIQSQTSPHSWKLQRFSEFEYRSIGYNVTIEFYWSPFLVESNYDGANNHTKTKEPTVRIKSIEKHGRRWMDADILVFDSFKWWTFTSLSVLWGSFESPDGIYKRFIDMPRLYELALNTWSDWLEMQIDWRKTKVFLRSHSPYHYGDSNHNKLYCKNYMEPILEPTHWPNSVNHRMMRITESILQKLEERGVKVEYLNITQLSGYRIDAHPSIYIANKSSRFDSDCLHWCLPGVPDTWNQILYTYIMKF